MFTFVFFLSQLLTSPAEASFNITCSPPHLSGSGVRDSYTTPAGFFMKKAFVQQMHHECNLNWTERQSQLDLQIPTSSVLVDLLEYKPTQIENFAVLSTANRSPASVMVTTETPPGEKWRFYLKNQMKVVQTPGYLDIQSEASSSGANGTVLKNLPGGSPGSDRVKYIQFRIRSDVASAMRMKISFQTMSAVDISGFAAGIAFKMFQGNSNQEALKKFERATKEQAQHIGEALSL